MKTRLLFWVLLACGVATLMLNTARRTPAGGVIVDHKCSRWDCANYVKADGSTGYYNGWIRDVNGQIRVGPCDLDRLGLGETLIGCMSTYYGIDCITAKPNSVCLGAFVTSWDGDDHACHAEFTNCSNSTP